MASNFSHDLLSFKKISLFRVYEVFIIASVVALAESSFESIMLGSSLSILGAGIRIWTKGYQEEKHDSSVYGPYRFVRHPHQLGTFLTLLGLCIASRSPVATGMMLLGSIFLFREIFREEDRMGGSSRGLLYRDYRLRVPTFVPNLLPYRGKMLTMKTFSLSRSMLQNNRRELDRLVGLAFAYVLMFGFTLMTEPFYWQIGISLMVFIYCTVSLLIKRSKLS